jgi:hypothetical protein
VIRFVSNKSNSLPVNVFIKDPNKECSLYIQERMDICLIYNFGCKKKFTNWLWLGCWCVFYWRVKPEWYFILLPVVLDWGGWLIWDTACR